MKNRLSVKIRHNRPKLTELFLFSVVFVVLGSCFMFLPCDSILTAVIMRTIGVINVLFFGLGAVIFGKQLLDKGPALIIDETGITDPGGTIPAGFIPWEDISCMYRWEMPSHEILMIKVKDPAAYINRQSRFFTRKTAALNNKIYGTPVCINIEALQYSYDDLMYLMHQKFSEHNLSNPATEIVQDWLSAV